MVWRDLTYLFLYSWKLVFSVSDHLPLEEDAIDNGGGRLLLPTIVFGSKNT